MDAWVNEWFCGLWSEVAASQLLSNARLHSARSLSLSASCKRIRMDRIYARNFEVPAGGGVGTARAIARAYSVFAADGKELGLQPETLRALAAPAIPPTRGFYDECLRGDDGVQFSLGFMKHCPVWAFGSDSSFGAPGTGGSLGFADPKTGIAYAYVTSRMGTSVTGDPRELALRKALDSVVAAS
jgi:CubicO group peptidase (beta-lactamase class C family)